MALRVAKLQLDLASRFRLKLSVIHSINFRQTYRMRWPTLKRLKKKIMQKPSTGRGG